MWVAYSKFTLFLWRKTYVIINLDCKYLLAYYLYFNCLQRYSKSSYSNIKWYLVLVPFSLWYYISSISLSFELYFYQYDDWSYWTTSLSIWIMLNKIKTNICKMANKNRGKKLIIVWDWFFRVMEDRNR